MPPMVRRFCDRSFTLDTLTGRLRLLCCCSVSTALNVVSQLGLIVSIVSLSDVCLLAGLPKIQTVIVMFADLVMIAMGLFAALQDASEKSRWFLYAVSCAFFLVTLYYLVVPGRQAASLQSSNVRQIYNVTAAMIVVLWTGYPIVFALTEGSNKLSVDAEVIAYGVLDVVSLPLSTFFDFSLTMSFSPYSTARQGRLRHVLAHRSLSL